MPGEDGPGDDVPGDDAPGDDAPGDDALSEARQDPDPQQGIPREGTLLCSIEIPSLLKHRESLVTALLDTLPAPRDGRLAQGVRLCLDEAVCNAIEHGNRRDATRMVSAEARLHLDRWCVIVSDEGEGFDPGAVPDPKNEAGLLRESGRGLLLMRELMDEVSHHRGGRTVCLAIRVPAEPA